MDRLDISKNRAIQLASRYVDSHWISLDENEVELSILSGGFSSRMYLVEDISISKPNPIKKFLIRLYGGKLLIENDPIKPEGGEIKETLVFYAVGLAVLGPKLYGEFDGGRIEEFVPSHMLREKDFDERPDTVLEFARKLARYHSLNLPIIKERHRILDACEIYYQQRNMDQFRELCSHVGIDDIAILEEFDVKSEIEWLKRVENVVNGRIVTTSGDVNNNNILVRDVPDKFGERVMMIDYELTALDYRGRDLGQHFITKGIQMVDGMFSISCDYPDESWRRLLITEYLKETKKLNYFEWDEKLDSVDHVLMEADFFMFHSIQMLYGFFLNHKSDSRFYEMPVDSVRSMMEISKNLIECYHERKAIFIEAYGQNLDLK